MNESGTLIFQYVYAFRQNISQTAYLFVIAAYFYIGIIKNHILIENLLVHFKKTKNIIRVAYVYYNFATLKYGHLTYFVECIWICI